jgi:hypothetical protein
MKWLSLLSGGGLLCFAAIVSADSEQEWEYETDSSERELKIEFDNNEVEIEAEVEKKNATTSTEREDKLKWQFKTRSESLPKGGMEFKFSYSVEQETATTESEAEITFRVRVGKIIEFTNTTLYNKVSSAVVQEYAMTQWGDFTQTQNGGIYIFQATTTDGVVSIIARISPTAVMDTDATALSPDAVKVDIKVENFPYQSSTSKLCMVGQLKSKLEVEAEIDDDRRRLGETRRLDTDDDEDDFEIENPQLAQLRTSASEAIPVGRFDWKKTIKGDDKHYAVKTSQEQTTEAGDDDEPNEKNYMMYWTFDTATEVQAPASGGSGAFGVATKTTSTAPTTTSSAPTTTSTEAGTTADSNSTNSSRRLVSDVVDEGRMLSALPRITTFIWDPTIGVAYKKSKTPSAAPTVSHSHRGARYLHGISVGLVASVMVSFM